MESLCYTYGEVWLPHTDVIVDVVRIIGQDVCIVAEIQVLLCLSWECKRAQAGTTKSIDGSEAEAALVN